MDFNGLIQDKLIKYRLENITHVQENTRDIQYIKKFQSYIKRWGGAFDLIELINEVENNKMVASIFAKDPLKQNITEDIIINILKAFNKDLKIIALSKGGKDSIRYLLKNGGIKTGRVKNKTLYTKSVDFIIYDGIKKYIVGQKYTNGKGGGQDNQKNDIISFLNVVKNLKLEDNIYYMAMLDGDYYTKKVINEIKEGFKDNKNIIIDSAGYFLD